ncbi:MAG: PIG-L family deacetylase [Intestinibacter bartlettii]|uniref:PIG-L family deacetylase n=1 Tax=Intestinibacter bartlettii TaxID=261299 RepID=UPI0026EBC82B|nr:PIG-L family deacetylase [Intestinibacter bartlettii]MDO5009407.1 PIG-L family deacetylase [Intestinibacter bartlettii]
MNKNKDKNITILIISLVVVLLIGIIDNSNSYDEPTFGDTVVFYPQHEDDETLWAASAILQAIEQRGADNVYIVLVSYGTGIKVLKDEKYSNLSNMQKYEYREREFLDAVKQLGIKNENIILLPRINNSDVTSFQLMEKTALDFERRFDNVTHVAHTYKYDWHLQHLKNGAVIQCLYNSGKIKHALYFIKPQYEEYIPNSEKVIYESNTIQEKNKIKNACMAYKLIDENIKRDGIGYKSDHKSFEDLMIKNRSILHTPNV